jgi:hypothetical protein
MIFSSKNVTNFSTIILCPKSTHFKIKEGKVVCLMSNKKFYGILVIIVVVIVGAIVGINTIKAKVEAKAEANKIEKLKQEYTELLDERMTNVYEVDYCKEYQLSDISYQVVDMKKTDDSVYTVSIVIDCSSANPDLGIGYGEFLAFGVESCVPGYEWDDKIIASTGDEIALRNRDTEDTYYGEQMMTVYVNGLLIHEPKEHDYSSSKKSNDKDTVECKSCGKKFQLGSENAKSIRKTNMCTNCYNNFKSVSDYLKEQPVD